MKAHAVSEGARSLRRRTQSPKAHAISIGILLGLGALLGCDASEQVEDGCEAEPVYDPPASNGDLLVSGVIPQPYGVDTPPAHVFVDVLEVRGSHEAARLGWSACARDLGISRVTLIDKLKRYGLRS